MATLLFWLSWRCTEPETRTWARLLERAKMRGRFAGIERAGEGFRLYAARTRDAEPAVLVESTADDGSGEILLLDRAVGADDAADREFDDWPESRLRDGTPTAAVRWNPSSRTLRLYRDLMGQRQLVYASIAGGVIVASGEDVLRVHPDVSTELDPLYLGAYFAGLAPAPDESVFRDIRCLGAGETLTIGPSNLRRTQIKLEPDHSWRTMRDEAIVERFRELFHRSVETACLGARRVGISLSAGLDSSSVAAVASRLPRELTGGVVGVTYGLDDFPSIDERPMVGELARELGFECRSFAADRMLPFAGPESRPVCPDTPTQSPYREWKEIAYRHFVDAGVDVRLDGAFADDLFAGGVEWVVDAIRFRRWRLCAVGLLQLLNRDGLRALLSDTAVRRPVSRALGRVSRQSERLQWLHPEIRETIRARLAAEAMQYREFPNPQQCANVLGGSAAFAACAEHWFSQRHAVEQRLPYRDLALTRWCLSLPADFSWRFGQRKWLLREAVRGVLPERLRNRVKGSDLTPVFTAMTRAQEDQLATFSAAAETFRQSVARPWHTMALGQDKRPVAQWLAATFGSWHSLNSGSTAPRGINPEKS